MVSLIFYSCVAAFKPDSWSVFLAPVMNQRDHIGHTIHGCCSVNLSSLSEHVNMKGAVIRELGTFFPKSTVKSIFLNEM